MSRGGHLFSIELKQEYNNRVSAALPEGLFSPVLMAAEMRSSSTSNPYFRRETMSIKNIVFIVVFAVFIVYYASVNKDLSGYSDEAVTFVQAHVRNQLQNPGNAHFEMAKPPVVYGGGGKYEVRGVVEYRNDSGKVIRSSYTAVAVFSGKEGGDFTIEKFGMQE